MMNARCISGIIAFVGCVAAYAETYRTNTVEGLIYILTNYSDSAVIELETGDYQMPEVPTYAAEPGSTSFGRSSIYLRGQTIRGLGNTPYEVRLVGSKKHRVVHGESESTLENLTITNGYTDNSDKTTYGYSNRCAGYYGSGVLTNCIITGNSARSEGGGINGGARLYDCVVENNEARAGTGGGAYNVTAYRTIFRNNTSSTNGAGVVAANLYDCTVSNNVANGLGGGAYNLNYATNTTFAGNTANYGGGGVYNCNLLGCWVKDNQTSGNGGGVYMDDSTKIVSNCDIVGNICSNAAKQVFGGGVYIENGAIDECEIRGNASVRAGTPHAFGGGIASKTGVNPENVNVKNCVISDNFASRYGGGAYMTHLNDCILSNNVSVGYGANAYECHLFGGEVVGSTIMYGSATGVKFHDFASGLTLSGNKYSSQSLTVGYVYQYPNCTNCLFYGNQLPRGYVFSGESTSSRSTSLVNCTIVSNACNSMFCNFFSSDFPLRVENSIFYGNYYLDGDAVRARDLHTYQCDVAALRFSHCVYGVSALKVDSVANTAGWFDDGNFQFGVTQGIADTPGFALGRNPDHPYSLKRNSTLLDLAKVADWMNDAYDLRGNADDGRYRRLSDDGKADLGCYQCWYGPMPMRIIIR